jgi:preprotein translocase subunit YajC
VSGGLASVLLAQEGGAAPRGGAPGLDFLLPMVAIFLIFYFLMIRPQQRRQREQEQMLKAVEKGDKVVTTGGLHGTVVGTTDEVLTLEVGAGGQSLRVKVDRARIERRIAKAKEGEEK